ncbi:hypothetical protein [Pseudomonas chlororaphis]|uniref:hypothetical protein n=1 Tax=Pseudomonas chlororaphis TaxID=587753 RepID=UPI000F587DF7|nr:hypothetical protein [Pseudomonas chlororaphis]AZC72373.1 hypothetical protein C4K32_5756 [Pseudomonas chlororaphis subsp. piscium]
MSNEPPDQEKRSREVADKIRVYLTALNTGGIAITFGVAGSLVSQKVSPTWAVCPVLGFVVGLVILGVSLFLAKHKAQKRRDDPNRDFTKWYWRNFTYDLLSLGAFIAAVGLGLWQLYYLRLSWVDCSPSVLG